MTTSDREVARDWKDTTLGPPKSDDERMAREALVGATFIGSPDVVELIERVTTALTTARQEQAERDAKLAEAMGSGETYGTGRQKAINIAAAIRAAAQKGEGE